MRRVRVTVFSGLVDFAHVVLSSRLVCFQEGHTDHETEIFVGLHHFSKPGERIPMFAVGHKVILRWRDDGNAQSLDAETACPREGCQAWVA